MRGPTLDMKYSRSSSWFYARKMQLSREEINLMYGTRHIGRDQARGLVGLMDFFCFSEVSFSIGLLFLEPTCKKQVAQ